MPIIGLLVALLIPIKKMIKINDFQKHWKYELQNINPFKTKLNSYYIYKKFNTITNSKYFIETTTLTSNITELKISFEFFKTVRLNYFIKYST